KGMKSTSEGELITESLFKNADITDRMIFDGYKFRRDITAGTKAYGYLGMTVAKSKELFKPNTKYTIITNVTKNTFTIEEGRSTTKVAHINSYNYAGNIIESSPDGSYSNTYD